LDKTQIVTIGLAARFDSILSVVLGTTLGMMLANVPAVLIGGKIADKLPLEAFRIAAVIVFPLLDS
jgi:putative Ca2+/H+ antiporter (TMEM165/GDT1 family)